MDKYFKKGFFNQNNISAIFISQFFFKLNFLKILIFFKKRKLKIASFWNPGILIFKKNKNKTIYEKLKKLTFNFQLKYFLFFAIMVPLFNKIRLKKRLFYDYLFVAGKQYEKLFFKDRSNENTKLIKINTFDYSRNFNLKKIRKLKYRYAIYLAEPGPGNFSDSSYLGLNAVVEKMDIYLNLCKFFSEVEKKLKLKIIIASHPKSENDHKLYRGFDVFKHQTAELTKHCEFVMHKQSTSISYAILNYKPIIFLTNNDFIKYDQWSHKYSIHLAKYFKSQLVNVNKKFDLINFKKQIKINRKIYKKYISDYLCSEKYKNNYQIISRHI
jgi:hypothetical protein